LSGPSTAKSAFQAGLRNLISGNSDLGASVILIEHGDVDEVGGLKRAEFSVARLISLRSFPMTGLGCPARFGSYFPQAR
jgi:hypothetical protein